MHVDTSNLEDVIKRLKTVNPTIPPDECEFFRKEIPYQVDVMNFLYCPSV